MAANGFIRPLPATGTQLSKQRRPVSLVPSSLLKGMGELQDTQLISMTADNL